MLQIITLSILYTVTYVTNVLAFQTVPVVSRCSVVDSSKQHHFFNHYHPSTSLQLQLDAKNDGYDDWYIDDEEYNKSPVDNIPSVNGSKSAKVNTSTNNSDTSDNEMIRTYFATCIPGKSAR